MTFLTSVGPLMMRGEELRFLHHSFAEHLAATSMARQLPEELTEDHSSFVHLLHDARDEICGRYPRTVLLHYTRLRPPQADRLVRSLHAGTADDHLLAARLLAKHIPASAGVVDEFLVTARAWAMTNQYPSRAILHHVTRAAHHPGLVPWLVELSTHEKAPWPSRVTAAIALATRLDKGHADQAADLLQAVVHDADLPVSHRLDAAEGLAECGAARREVAQRGLRLLLADASTPATRRRAATVVLAGLGSDARAHAVESLFTTLDDPWSPVNHVVEAATALAEIGMEFHDRCATVFRSVLRTTREWTAIRNAARGLAALGPHYVHESAHALITFASSRVNTSFQRAQSAETLRELGPQFGMAAGELVRGMLAEPATAPHERSWYAYTLARLGSAYYSQAAAHLKVMVESAHVRNVFDFVIADGLIELGPEYHEEAARALRYAAEDPLSEGWSRSVALGRLLKLGQAHRAYASDRLRDQICDQGLDLDTRIWAASELVRLGPEFHLEIETFLLKVISQESLEHDQIPLACSTLANLGVEHHDIAARTLVAILRSPFLNNNSLANAAANLARLGPEHRTTASTLLNAVLTDPAWTDQQRTVAAEALAQLGGEYDRCALDGLLSLLRQDGVDLSFGLDWSAFSSMGVRPRRELAGALRTQMSDPHAGPDRIVGLAKMIARFSDDHVASAVDALEAVLADDTAVPWPRFDAASALVALRPDRRAAAVEMITHWVEPVNIFWILRGASSTLAKLGHDAVPMVHAVLADLNVERALRQEAAVLLPELGPDTVGAAVAELRCQMRDEHLDDQARSEIAMSLVELDSANRADAITLHRQLLDDEEQPIPIRCHAAQQVVRLDRTLWPDTVALVRRLLSDPFATAADRLAATQCLDQLNALDVNEKQRATRALVRDPALGPSDRREAIDLLRGRMRLDAQRLQLDDHRARMTNRKPVAQSSAYPPPLRVETEEAIREVLNAPESSLQDRVDAAVALAGMTFRLIPEAVEILTGIADGDTRAQFAVLFKLASLDSPSRRTALRRAEAMVADESLPARHRRRAAQTLIYIDYSAKLAVRDFLRAAAADRTLAGVCRVAALHALRHIDGPEPLRALRDDVHLPLPVRVQSAAQLVDFTADDRATATRMLGQVAADRQIRPALRLHATKTLAKLGIAGRRQAIDALTHMLRDDTLPATARDLSAWQLAKICPARRPEVIAVLHEIRTVANPLHRIAVLVTLGMLDPEEATPLLHAMAEDRTLNPVARLRAAEELADLRQDQCEAAALIARELMRDGNVRRHAACDLARWSRVCRQEARDMIIHIDSTHRRVDDGHASVVFGVN